MGKTQKEREVVELLKVYRDHHTPGGSSPDATMNLEAMSGYEPGFPIGARLSKLDKKLLTKSLEHLGHALTMLRADYYGAYSAISLAYLQDSADPSMVEDRRKKAGSSESARRFVTDHDRGIEDLAFYLRKVDLYVPWTKRMTSREEKQVERRNDELYRLYLDYRESMSRNKAIETASEHCGYSRSRGYEIVDLREGKAS